MSYVGIEQAQQCHASILSGPLCREEMVLTVGKIRKMAKNHVEQARAPRWPWYSRKQLPSLINTVNVPGQPSQPGRCQCNKQPKPHVVRLAVVQSRFARHVVVNVISTSDWNRHEDRVEISYSLVAS